MSIALCTRELRNARYSIKEWAGETSEMAEALNIICPWKATINGHNCQRQLLYYSGNRSNTYKKFRNVYSGTTVRVVGSAGVSAPGGSSLSPHTTRLHGMQGRAWGPTSLLPKSLVFFGMGAWKNPYQGRLLKTIEKQ